MKGWSTAYINIPQAAGLATERLSAHVGQRIRWARGMIQILRIDNPLFAPGLKFPQRLCYFNAMPHFLYAVPRLIFLTAPLIYLLLDHTNVPGYWAAILAYALPHLILSNITNSRIQGEHRHSFWNEIYETVLSPYILLPTLMALINPKTGQVQRHAQGRGGEEDVLRHPHCTTLRDSVDFQPGRHSGGDSAFPDLGSRSSRHGPDERGLVCVQRGDPGGHDGGGAGNEASADHGSHSHGDGGDGQAGRWACRSRRDHRCVPRRNQHPFQRDAGRRSRGRGNPHISAAVVNPCIALDRGLVGRIGAAGEVREPHHRRTGSTDHGAVFARRFVAGLG